MNDGDSKLTGRAFFNQNGYVYLTVTIKITLQIRGIQAKGEACNFFRQTRSLGRFLLHRARLASDLLMVTTVNQVA